MNSAAETNFLDLGRTGKSAWWRYLLGGSFVLLGYSVCGIVSYVVIVVIAGVVTMGGLPSFDKTTGMAQGIDPIISFVGLNVSFLYLILFTFAVVRLALKRPLLSLITPHTKLDWKRMGVGFATWFCLNALLSLITYLVYPQNFKLSFQMPEYFFLAPVVLFFTPLQCFAEELFFRGYLLQFLGKFNKSILILSILNGFLFTLPHLSNPEMSQGPVPIGLGYFAIGFFLSVLTLRTNSIEIAIGAHTANNIFAALVVNYANSPLQTRSVFVLSKLEPWFDLGVLVLLEIAFYIIVMKYIRSTKR